MPSSAWTVSSIVPRKVPCGCGGLLLRGWSLKLCIMAIKFSATIGCDAWVVMPNHVHLLITPCVELPKIMHSVKGFTAREANRLLGRTGSPFWQKEFFDHWIRNEREFERIRAYIERNPVTAGLAASPEEYCWSSAHVEAG